MKLVFATQNQGKIKEIRQILPNFEVITAQEAGISEDVEENGKTFEENALKKARFIAKETGEWTIADDSGLCIKALGNAPGVYTARWAGEDASGDDLVNHTLNQMKDVPAGKRDAWFESVAAIVAPNGNEWVFSGKVHGSIAPKAKGKKVPYLPYDVLFIPRGEKKTFAQMDDEKKNEISHRAFSFLKLKKFLEEKIK